MWRPPRNLIMIASPTSARKRSKPIKKRVILALGDLYHVNATTKPSGFFHATMKPEGFWILTRGHSSSPEIGSSGAAQSGAPTKTVAISTLTLQTRGYCRLSAKPMRTAGTRSAVAATSRHVLPSQLPALNDNRAGSVASWLGMPATTAATTSEGQGCPALLHGRAQQKNLLQNLRFRREKKMNRKTNNKRNNKMKGKIKSRKSQRKSKTAKRTTHPLIALSLGATEEEGSGFFSVKTLKWIGAG
jgi:hypothetical protein